MIPMSKIYELAEQAAEHAVLNFSSEILQSETEDTKVEIPKEFIDKFSELIVRETLQVARAGVEFGDGMESAVEHYFGIKL